LGVQFRNLVDRIDDEPIFHTVCSGADVFSILVADAVFYTEAEAQPKQPVQRRAPFSHLSCYHANLTHNQWDRRTNRFASFVARADFHWVDTPSPCGLNR
jgi:hypothetical protein